MIIRHRDEVFELDVEKNLKIEGAKTTVRWLVSSEVGGEEYGHRFALRYFVMQPGGYYPLHKHHYVEAVYLISGKIQFAGEDNEWKDVIPGSVVYTARWEPHQLRCVSDEPATFTCTIDCEAEGEPCYPQAKC